MNTRLRRFAPIGGLVTAFSLAFAGSALAGGGGFPPPGNYTFKDSFAFAGYQISPPGPTGGGDFVSLNVDRGVNSFRPPGGEENGSTVITRLGTVLNLSASISSTGTFEFGCWIIPDKDFVVADSLHAASLDTQITDQTLVCPGVPTGPAAALGKGLAPKGGGGGGANFPLPLSVHAAWTWKGLVGTSQDEASFKCGDLSTQSESSTKSAISTSTGRVSGINAVLSDAFAQVSRSQSQQHVRGQLPDNCSPF